MRLCLTDEQLELLVRGHAPWIRGLFWRRHLAWCGRCQARMDQLRADEHLIQELRQALPGPGPETSPLSAARSMSGIGGRGTNTHRQSNQPRG